MKLEHYSVEKLKKEIKEIVGKHLDLEKYAIFFFGSRIDGTSHERSDIDVGIEGTESINGVIMSNIKEALDKLQILYKIEFVDFNNVSRDFYQIAKRHIEKI